MINSCLLNEFWAKVTNLFDEIFFEKKPYEKNVRQVCKYVDTKVRRKVEKRGRAPRVFIGQGRFSEARAQFFIFFK